MNSIKTPMAMESNTKSVFGTTSRSIAIDPTSNTYQLRSSYEKKHTVDINVQSPFQQEREKLRYFKYINVKSRQN